MERTDGLLSRTDTIKAMNSLAASSVPFVFLISFDGDQNYILPAAEASANGFYLDMPGMVTHSFHSFSPDYIEWHTVHVDIGRYYRAFKEVIREIHHGNSFLLNLTFPTRVTTNLTLQEIFACGRAPFKLYFRDSLVVFSPERFVRIRGNTIFSNPMKGTIDASIPDARMRLRSDMKEDAEHNTIVDLIRNDLSMVASDVKVRRFKYIDKVRTHQGELLQMSSEITGRLTGSYRDRLGELLFKLLPAGSISGAPKPKTVEIIRKVEQYDRGFYTGIFGYFDGKDLDSAVAIRYLERNPDGYLFKSGGGITFRSDWEKEYNEMIDKVYVPVY